MTSYLSESEAENLQNGDAHLPQIHDFEWNISRTIWRIEVSEGSFFRIFHALSFELNVFFDGSFPLTVITTNVKTSFSFQIRVRPN